MPIGTTDVFGITFTLTSFNGIPPNKFNLKSIFPTLLVSAVILLEVWTASYSSIFLFFKLTPKTVLTSKVSPWNSIIFSGIEVMFVTYINIKIKKLTINIFLTVFIFYLTF